VKFSVAPSLVRSPLRFRGFPLVLLTWVPVPVVTVIGLLRVPPAPVYSKLEPPARC